MALRMKSDSIPNNVKLGGEVEVVALLTGSYGLRSFLEPKTKLMYSHIGLSVG
jgi:hypothetical protein